MKNKYDILSFCTAVLLILVVFLSSLFHPQRKIKNSNTSLPGNWDNSMIKGKCYGKMDSTSVVGNYSFNGAGTEGNVESSYSFNGGGEVIELSKEEILDGKPHNIDSTNCIVFP